jgi:hypothetical protein
VETKSKIHGKMVAEWCRENGAGKMVGKWCQENGVSSENGVSLH